MKFAKLALATAALIAVAPANAAYYALNYTANDGAPLPTSASFRIQTSDVLNGAGGYDILAASGSYTVNGVTTSFKGLAPVNPPGFNTDNVFFTTDPAFSNGGIGLLTAAGDANLWGNGPASPYTFYVYEGGGYSVQTTGTLDVSPATGVPEAGVWLMLIAGFGMVGTAARRRATVAA